MPEYNYKLFADYFQFYLQDEQAEGDLSNGWTSEAMERELALAPGTIGVGTARNMTVPVSVEVREFAPQNEDFSIWDQVNECSMDVPSGSLVIAGCTDDFFDAARISLSPGCYRARIYYGQLYDLSDDGLEGNDHYKIVLWPSENSELKILKQKDRP